MNRLFVATDGDNVGQQVGTAILRDDASQLSQISKRIDAGNQAIKDWVSANGGQMISAGGDESSFMVDPSKQALLNELKDRYEQASGATLTVGTGLSLSQAGKALIAGKLQGKNVIVNYDDHVEQVLQQAHAQVGSGQGDLESQKMDEHYIGHVMGDEDDDMSGEQHEEMDEPVGQEDEESFGEMPENAEEVPTSSGDGSEAGAGSGEMPEGSEQDPSQEEEGSEEEIGSGPAEEECDCPACQEARAAAGQVGDEPDSEDQGADLGYASAEGEPAASDEDLEPEEEDDTISFPEGDSMDGDASESDDEDESPRKASKAADDTEGKDHPEDQIEAPAAGSTDEDEQGGEDLPGSDNAPSQEEMDSEEDNDQAAAEMENPEEAQSDESMPPADDDSVQDETSEDPEASVGNDPEDMMFDQDAQGASDDDIVEDPDMGPDALADDGSSPPTGEDDGQVAEAADGAAQGEPSELELLSSLLQDSESHDETKQKIATILERFKANRDVILGLRDSNPQLYTAIIGTIKQCIDMAKHLQGGDAAPVGGSPDAGDASLPKQ